MQILIDIPDSLSTEKIDQIITKIENQLKNESESIKVEKVKPRKVFAQLFEVDRINIPNRDSLHDR
jgi:divalent metal cation (Fe/Co/Zn/Cd) transporter